ncbi:MAG: DUF309 domain-containing protein [Thermoplasmataceae archaeon]
MRMILFIENTLSLTQYDMKPYCTRRPIVRKHTDSIELDISTDSPSQFIKAMKFRVCFLRIRKIAKTEEYFTLNREKILQRKEDMLQTASCLFDEERYWEAHMLLEDLWKCVTGSERAYIQNIIHLAVAMIKFQMNQKETAKIVFERAVNRMSAGKNAGSEYFEVPEKFEYPLSLRVAGN